MRINSALLIFGIMAFFGVVAGSFVWSLVSRTFRIEWFASFKDFATHLIGAVLMGFGGVLAMGCTIGQGVTGISTLALGSFITFISIVLGSALTMKVQLYKRFMRKRLRWVRRWWLDWRMCGCCRMGCGSWSG